LAVESPFYTTRHNCAAVVILGRFEIRGRLLMSVGGGFQIATTRYHTYNHAAVFTVRFPF
jgi:hypothetical protein